MCAGRSFAGIWQERGRRRVGVVVGVAVVGREEGEIATVEEKIARRGDGMTTSIARTIEDETEGIDA